MIVTQHSSKRWVWLLVIVVLLLATFACVTFYSKPLGVSTTGQDDDTIKSQPQPTSISSNVLFMGTTFFGRYINDWSMASSLKYAYPFSRLNEFDRGSYDAWIAGLECPTAAAVNMTSAEQEAALQFNCSPEYLPEAAKWFTAFSIANNHTDNQGEAGFLETRQHLEENNIQYFGHYDYQAVDDACEVISLPVTVEKSDGSTEKGELPVAMCGFHGVYGIPVDAAVSQMRDYGKYMPVIAMPHMGAEYKSEPDQLKIDFYRNLIDNGADMVLADHPHWIQTTESYKGHLIVYSMGNFIFDQQDTAEVMRSAAIRVVLSASDADSKLLSSWLELGKTCGDFKDECLAQAKTLNLEKLQISYKFGVVGTDDSDKLVKPASTELSESILTRLNWQSTVEQLQPPYSSL